MQIRQLGPFQVSAISLGCMNLSHAYGTPPAAADAERLLLTALDAGVTHFDTAPMYGFGLSETLIGKTLSRRRGEFMLASKGGLAGVDVKLSADLMLRAEAFINQNTVTGGRYNAQAESEVDTETF